MWLPCLDDDRYEVSDMGEVRNAETGRVLKLRDSNGYRTCYITRNSHTSCFMVHRMVAKAFLPIIPEKNVVDHINHDKTNNTVANLRWTDTSQNNRNRRRFHSRTDGLHNIAHTGNKFVVSFMKDRQTIRKTFDSQEEAIAYRDEWIKEHQP